MQTSISLKKIEYLFRILNSLFDKPCLVLKWKWFIFLGPVEQPDKIRITNLSFYILDSHFDLGDMLCLVASNYSIRCFNKTKVDNVQLEGVKVQWREFVGYEGPYAPNNKMARLNFVSPQNLACSWNNSCKIVTTL